MNESVRRRSVWSFAPLRCRVCAADVAVKALRADQRSFLLGELYQLRKCENQADYLICFETRDKKSKIRD